MVCTRCGTNYDGNFCPNCGNPATQQKRRKSIVKRWWFWFLIAIVSVLSMMSFLSCLLSISMGDNASQSATTSANKYYVGDVVNINGLQITFDAAEEWESYSEPQAGYMYIRIKISAKNTSSSDQNLYSFDFTCYADDEKQHEYYGDNQLNGGTISPGRKAEGYLYYIVPTDAKNIELEYDCSLWGSQRAILVIGSAP